MKTHKQLSLVILAFLMTGACIVVLDSTAVIGAMCGAFLGTVSAYTTLDLEAIIKRTKALPPGSFEYAERWKYFTGVVLMCLLFCICLIKQFLTGLDFELAYGFLGPGSVAVIAFVISGIKRNKAATLDGPIEISINDSPVKIPTHDLGGRDG